MSSCGSKASTETHRLLVNGTVYVGRLGRAGSISKFGNWLYAIPASSVPIFSFTISIRCRARVPSFASHLLTTLPLRHTFTVLFQAQNSPFSANLFHHSLLAPTWTAFSVYTGPDLLCSTVFIVSYFLFVFILVRAAMF